MKFMDRVELVVRLKEKIYEAKSTNDELASQLQKLLDQILTKPQNNYAI